MNYFLNQMILIFFHFIGPNTHLREKKPSFRADAQTAVDERWGLG